MDIKHFCTFKGGKPVLKNPKGFMDACRLLDGKEGFLIINKEVKKRTKSNEQQKYYFGVVVAMIAEHFGFEKHEHQMVHRAISEKFLSEEKNGLKIVRTTALDSWSTYEWETYMDQVRRWALVDYALEIPLPNEVL